MRRSAVTAAFDADIGERMRVIEEKVATNEGFRQDRLRQVNRQQWFIVIGGMLGLLLVGFRGEQNTTAVLESRLASCQARHDQMVQFNSTRDDIGLKIIALSPNALEDTKQDMLKAMAASKIAPPDCSLIHK